VPEFDQPAWLLALAAALLPWWRHGQRRIGWASLGALPPDRLSAALDLGLRALASLALAAAALSLGGAHRQGEPIERTGTGAHVVVVLDRSASMADGFAGTASRAQEEPKGEAAARLLDAFVRQRPHDLFGVVFFSTAPMRVLGLGGDHEGVRAAIASSAVRGVGLTNISAGLTMALESFRDQPRSGSRVVLLVSDGAASIDARAQRTIRSLFEEQQARLYWIYLRSPSGNSPTQPPAPDAEVAPEYELHRFFDELGVPYRLYEADNPRALERAIGDVSRLQNLPLRYLEARPRRELAPWLDALALGCVLALLAARLLERARWQG